MPLTSYPSLADYSPQELIFMADEHDDMAFASMLAHHKQMSSQENYYEILTGIMNPFANMMFGMQVPDAEQRVEQTTQWLTQTNAPAFWWIGPCTTPKNLDQMLTAKGWKEGKAAPAMVVELDRLSGNYGPANLELREVTNEEELTNWQVVFGKGYELPDDVGQLIKPTLGGSMRLYTALLDETPVGTTGMFIHKGVPGIYCVSTIPEFRGRGIGAAITALPLIEARKEGYQLGTLQASTMGYPVYKKLGFQDVCELRVFSLNL